MAEEKQKAPTGRPTPTQAELDKINKGEEVTLSDDGSGPDPFAQEEHKKSGVQTRQSHSTHTSEPKAR